MDIVGIDLPEPETGINSSHETTNGLIKGMLYAFALYSVFVKKEKKGKQTNL